MKIFTSKKLSFVIAATLAGALVGCTGEDGKDGVDGVDGVAGTPGDSWTPPAVSTSAETNVNVINYTLGEGQITYEFEVTNENGELINGLRTAQGKVSALTEKGFINNRDEADINGVADNVHIGGTVGFGTFDRQGNPSDTEGATLTALGDGHYEFTAPMAGVNAGTEGLVWLTVGGHKESGIAASARFVVNKPEGAFSTATEACYSCHVDYSTSPNQHSAYVAQGMDGEVEFVAGCMACHGSVSRGVKNAEGFSEGGYATNTLSKIGHINHRDKFTKDFSVMNCSSCHVDATVNINIAGPGCIDCHDTGGVPGNIQPSNGADVRNLHQTKSGIAELKAVRAEYTVEISTPERVADVVAVADHYAGSNAAPVSPAPGWCSTLTVKDAAGNIVNIEDNYNDAASTTGYDASKPIVYASYYLHAETEEALVGRPGNRSNYSYGYNADGTKTLCHDDANIDFAGFPDANLVASARVSFSTEGWMNYDGNVRGQTGDRIRANGYDGSMGVSFTAYSGAVDPVTTTESKFERRKVINDNSCTTCHNDATAFHKNGAFDEGGRACIACHDNGMARTSADVGAGFGPMVHGWHWGNGSLVGEVEKQADGSYKQTGKANGAGAIAPQTSCAACHDSSVDLAKVPTQYILEPGSKMTSPVTANCVACHNDASAKAHMDQNGGYISIGINDLSTEAWYSQMPEESCATCHNTGSSFGIEKYHNFTR
ncbi:cytochrome C [Shewanella sp. AS1]|uniref:multiheme c-type cytochrome n=1 Tax=Shewanella sp. AS1 TaxID=2907626 RepID=UPI001F32F55C|nr:cytochrome c3 family protein [Shewanella sp. AS1]MCE9678195.1 cytochrome C [Shewanella sp. AS1]